MTPALRIELVRLGITLVPGLLITAVGCLAAGISPNWMGLGIGGAIAVGLAALGGLMVAFTYASPLHIAAFAALASFTIRIGGAGAFGLVLGAKAWGTGAIIGLAGGLLAALALDLLTWFRASRRADVLLTSAKESARA